MTDNPQCPEAILLADGRLIRCAEQGSHDEHRSADGTATWSVPVDDTAVPRGEDAKAGRETEEMADLTTFLSARLDEDERYLKSNRRHLWTERPLREVAAKRALIRIAFAHQQTLDGEWGCCHDADEIAAWKCPDIRPNEIDILRHIAAIWSDHPDYRPEWAPEGETPR